MRKYFTFLIIFSVLLTLLAGCGVVYPDYTADVKHSSLPSPEYNAVPGMSFPLRSADVVLTIGIDNNVPFLASTEGRSSEKMIKQNELFLPSTVFYYAPPDFEFESTSSMEGYTIFRNHPFETEWEFAGAEYIQINNHQVLRLSFEDEAHFISYSIYITSFSNGMFGYYSEFENNSRYSMSFLSYSLFDLKASYDPQATTCSTYRINELLNFTDYASYHSPQKELVYSSYFSTHDYIYGVSVSNKDVPSQPIGVEIDYSNSGTIFAAVMKPYTNTISVKPDNYTINLTISSDTNEVVIPACTVKDSPECYFGFGNGRNDPMEALDKVYFADYKDVELVFSDDFDGAELDRSKWKDSNGSDRNNSTTEYVNSLAHVDGYSSLIIRSEWDKEKNILRSGSVSTSGLFEFGQGYYEISARLPVSPGIMSSFFLMSPNSNRSYSLSNGKTASALEIDIVDSSSNTDHSLNNSLYWYDENVSYLTYSSVSSHRIDSVYDGKFHRFGLMRSSTEYIFYIDGLEIWRTSSLGIYNDDLFLNISSSADLSSTSVVQSVSQSELIVDYVKVWKLY